VPQRNLVEKLRREGKEVLKKSPQEKEGYVNRGEGVKDGWRLGSSETVWLVTQIGKAA